MNKIKTYFISILIPVLVGIVVSFIISPFMDYGSLEKPFLSPPSILFPIVWTILYILMGISYGIIKSNHLEDKEIDFIYYLQLIFNALWSIVFFVFKWRLFAFLWILILDILVIQMIRLFYNKNKLSGLLQITYLLWILFATYLNLAIYLLNR